MEGREVSETEIEIVPLTDDQTAAIRELRFCCTNLDHTVAFGLTKELTIAQRIGGGVTPVTRFTNRETGEKTIEYDVMMGHPEAVALVAEIQEARKTA
jgi:hypothetical protein